MIRLAPANSTITNSVGCNLPAYLGTGTIESLTDNKLVISGGSFLVQPYTINGMTVNYSFGSSTCIIIGAAGPVMTTEIIKVKAPDIHYGNPNECTVIMLEHNTAAPIAPGTPFYFCDPDNLCAVISSLLTNTSAVTATWYDEWGNPSTLAGYDTFLNDTTPERGGVITPIMIDATGTEVQVTNQIGR